MIGEVAMTLALAMTLPLLKSFCSPHTREYPPFESNGDTTSGFTKARAQPQAGASRAGKFALKAETTDWICRSVNSGYNGRDKNVSAQSSAFGNEPFL